MIGQPIALIRIPNQRVFAPKAAARYLDVHVQTLRKMTDEGQIRAKWMRNRKIYLLEELDRYIESLPDYNPIHGENPGLEKEAVMPINSWKDRRGRVKIYVSRQWPDGSRFRRVQPNMTVAKKTLARIEEAVAMGTWRELRKELALSLEGGKQHTVTSFADVYLGYCQTRNSRPDFKVQAFSSINRIVGHVKLSEMSVAHTDHFVKVRSQQDGVEPATVNRGLAVLRNMLNFAKRREYIDVNPLTGYEMLPERERALRILTVNEFRDLVHHVCKADPVIGVYVAVLGEVGLRKAEGIRLQWKDISTSDRKLTVRKSKNHRPRYVPISDFAMEKLASLIRVVGCPQVFVNPHTRTPWKDG